MKFRNELKWIIPLVLVCIVVFANSLSGTFVYDDLRQIVRNPLIQENSLIWKALTSDVWAFKGDGTIAASNYWRPTFTAWHIINYRLFGLEPWGWHLTNVLLHSGVCVMAFGLLRRWGLTSAIAFAITLIFAVHPIHVESVAWISGSPDLLFALAFLSSLWFMQSYAEEGRTKYLSISLLLYCVALGAKEIGILCLPIYYFVMTGAERPKKKAPDIKSTLLMFGGAAAAYFFARWAVLGAISQPPEGATSLGSAVLSIPEIFAFYLRQLFFPYWLGANYPVTPVEEIGAYNFLLPAAISIAAIAGIYYLAKNTSRGMLAASLFFLPLITAMNATAFIPDQIVHDRYLYLPLLGMLMLLVTYAAKFVPEKNVLIAGIVISAVLSIQTFAYNTAWRENLSLWMWTRQIDDSAFTSMQLASEFYDAGRIDDSIREYTLAIEKRQLLRSYLGRGRAYIVKKQYADAERDLTTALQFPPERQEAYGLYQTYEALGLMYSETGQFDKAIANFTEAREKLPIYAAAITVNLAIVLYQKGMKAHAIQELEGVRQQALSEMLPESKAVYLRLGMLYAEARRNDEARNALQEYLRLTSKMSDKNTLADRAQAARILQNLK